MPRWFRRNVGRLVSAVILAAAFGVLIGALSSPAMAQTNVLFIFDASGSMRQQVEAGQTRMSVAKRAMAIALKDLPKDVRPGLMLYGHRRAKDCKDIELVAPIASEDANALAARIAQLEPKGETPIAAALEIAARSFAPLKGQNNVIVLVTDGIEECGGDPCAAARAIKAGGLDLKAHIIGFTLNDKQRAAIECVVKETGGQYFEAKNPNALRDALQSLQRIIVEPGPPTPPPPPPPPPPERFNLLAQKNGGEMIFGSGPDWSRLIDEKLTYLYGFSAGTEGVFGFRDGRPAMFDTFAVYLPGTDSKHPKDIELLVGDEGPTGPFRSLGVITVANGKLRDGWQEFKLPPTTASFIKVKLLSNHGGNSFYLYEVRLYGELATTLGPASGQAVSRAGRIDILSQREGGEYLLGSGNDWKRVNDENLGYLYGFGVGAEGVFGFREGRTASFDTFAVYIPGTDTRHPKEIELFAGDESPTGTYRSLGVITVANGKLRDGWQEFKLPQTAAKFLKVKIVSNYDGNGVYLYELRLMGEVK